MNQFKMAPLASVEIRNSKTVAGAAIVVAPSEKLKVEGVTAKLTKFPASGEATVKDPDTLHVGGHAAPPTKMLKGLPV